MNLVEEFKQLRKNYNNDFAFYSVAKELVEYLSKLVYTKEQVIEYYHFNSNLLDKLEEAFNGNFELALMPEKEQVEVIQKKINLSVFYKEFEDDIKKFSEEEETLNETEEEQALIYIIHILVQFTNAVHEIYR